MTAHSDLDSAVAAYQGGAFEYLPKPFDIDQAVELVRRAAAQGSARPADADAGIAAASRKCSGQAPAMQEVFRAIGRLSRSSMTVLITGESGTGKELVARALHRHSPRAGKAVHRAQHVGDSGRAARVGAVRPREGRIHRRRRELRRGRFEQADGGTLFLDEIGDMSPPLQTRLLRVLAEGEFYRVGGQTPVKVDVRVIAATHQDLEDARGRRASSARTCFHRLNVIRIERAAAAAAPRGHPRAAAALPRVAAIELGVAPKIADRGCAARRSRRFDWPGNVRELVNRAGA